VRPPVAINVNNKLVAERDVHRAQGSCRKSLHIAQLLHRIIKIALNRSQRTRHLR
jgi:hypothetical protein